MNGVVDKREMEKKILSQEQIYEFYQFLDSFQGNNQIKNDIKFLINDYNNIIKSYLNLLQNSTNLNYNNSNYISRYNNTSINNYTNYNNYRSKSPDNYYSSYNNPNYNFQKMYNNSSNYNNSNINNNFSSNQNFNTNNYLTNKNNINNYNYNNNYNNTNNYTPLYYNDPTFNEKSIFKTLKKPEEFNPENYNTTPDLIKIKTTNEILKTIRISLNNPKLFSIKYTDNNNYQTFINNLLNYNYPLNILNDIKNDIERVSRYTPKIPTSPKRIIKEETPFDFSKSLRKYPDSFDDLDIIYKKPFKRFTNNYGGFFDKSLNKISSPLKHKRELE